MPRRPAHPGQRQTINTKVKGGGHSVLWVYAPGYVADNGLSVDAMAELTGMQMKKLAGAQAASILPMGDVLYADTSYLAITGETGGPRTLRLRAPATVEDLFSGATVATNAREFSFEFAPKTTRLFLLTPAK